MRLIRVARVWAATYCILSALVGQVATQEGVGYAEVMKGGATFYGDANGLGTIGGACGYGDLTASGYGLAIAAGSAPLYKGGLGCGTCFRIQCVNSPYCYNTSIIVPLTDFCPGGNSCCATCHHFDLSQPAFKQIADETAGVIELAYQRVPCSISGDMRLIVTGSSYWMNILFENVAGPGDIGKVEVAPSGGLSFLPMSHTWGVNWVYNGFLQAPLTFRVTSLLTTQIVTSKMGCLPINWVPGTYHCNMQFTSLSTSMPLVALPQSHPPPPPPPSPPPPSPPPPHHGWWWKVWHQQGGWWSLLRSKYRNPSPPPPFARAKHHKARRTIA